MRSTTEPGRLRRRLTVAVFGAALLPTLAVLLRRSLPLDLAAPLDWVGFSWLGIAFYVFLSLLVLEPVRLLLWLPLRRRRPGPAAVPAAVTAGPPDTAVTVAGSLDTEPPHAQQPPGDEAAGPSRRLFLARSLAVTAGAVGLATAGAGAVAANSAPAIRRVPITLPRLDPALDGLRIVTFSDAHLSSTYRGRRFERLVETVNAQQPDVVAIVGDMVDGELDDLREEIAPLADLVSRDGVYFVTGNHEYFVDTRAWLDHLPTLGVQVLRNERVAIERSGASVDLAGIDDRTAELSGVPGHGADLDAALDGRDDATPVVLLAHQPVMIERSQAAGVDLQLSGHTHGGQLWPFDYAILLDQPVVQGLSRFGDTQLYVTAGAGYWGPPMRVGSRPEVTVVELRAPAT